MRRVRRLGADEDAGGGAPLPHTVLGKRTTSVSGPGAGPDAYGVCTKSSPGAWSPPGAFIGKTVYLRVVSACRRVCGVRAAAARVQRG